MRVGRPYADGSTVAKGACRLAWLTASGAVGIRELIAAPAGGASAGARARARGALSKTAKQGAGREEGNVATKRCQPRACGAAPQQPRCGQSAARSSLPPGGALGVAAMLCVVQTAPAFAATPPAPQAAERRGLEVEVPMESRVTRRELSGQTVWPVDPGHDTLRVAYGEANAGDVLELRDGTYTGSGDDVLRIDRGIELRAQNAGMAVIDGEDARRCIRIDSGTVGLWGLNITRGRATVSPPFGPP